MTYLIIKGLFIIRGKATGKENTYRWVLFNVCMNEWGVYEDELFCLFATGIKKGEAEGYKCHAETMMSTKS
jgi:hypothetical protein